MWQQLQACGVVKSGRARLVETNKAKDNPAVAHDVAEPIGTARSFPLHDYFDATTAQVVWSVGCCGPVPAVQGNRAFGFHLALGDQIFQMRQY